MAKLEEEMSKLMDRGAVLVKTYKDLGYSPAQVIVICSSAIAQVLYMHDHLEMTRKSLDELTAAALENLPTIQ